MSSLLIAYLIVGAVLYAGMWAFTKERLLKEGFWCNAWVMFSCLTQWPLLFGVALFKTLMKRGAA